MQDKIELGMGRGAVTRAPHIIVSFGLGSCVAVTLYDTKRKIGGMAHIMLPDSASTNGRRASYQCADTAIATLVRELRANGAVLLDMVAKLVGGARMFADYEDSSEGIGEQNIKSVKHILKREQIPLIGEDSGGHNGRTVEFCLDSGKLVVKTIGKKAREI